MATANYIGVYSSLSGARRPSGGAPRKRYWFVWDDLSGGYIVQLLDAAYKPMGEPQPISAPEFNQRFQIEGSIFVTPLAKLEVADKPEQSPVSLDIPENLIEPAAKSDAARRMEEAAVLDRNLRDEFAIALDRLQRGEKAAAVNALERLANRREGIVPAHKHAFTDFGVNLRKSRLPAVAFKFYQRALELSPEDSNAYFNMARIMFDLGDYDGTEKHLQQALNLDVDFTEARKFLDFLARHRFAKARKSNKRTDKDDDPLSLILK